MELFFIRHGEAVTKKIDMTAPNRIERIEEYGSGNYHGGLTERGRRQAEQVGRFLRNRRIDRIYTSPTQRAFETAQLASKVMGLDVTVMEQLKEAKVGYVRPDLHPRLKRSMETALRINDVYARVTNREVFLPVALYFVTVYVSRWMSGRTQGGEPPDQVRSRLESVLDRLAEESDGQNHIALFSHGYLIYYIANHILAPNKKWLNVARHPYVTNVSVTRVGRTRNGWRLLSYAEPVIDSKTFGFGGN
ncbi:MAG: histidine phosphatase family protein [Deltaproteobacteria bacterium]|nr:histidine phosphatase family protein [Deltaproteobacteria bacterium]